MKAILSEQYACCDKNLDHLFSETKGKMTFEHPRKPWCLGGGGGGAIFGKTCP